MVTAHEAVQDGTSRRLSDDELGLLHRRLDEIKLRIAKGVLNKSEVYRALQAIIESKVGMLGPCTRHHRSERIAFKRPSVHDRKKSLAPMRVRLPMFLNRLFFYYKYKLKTGYWWSSGEASKLNPEDYMAMMWEAENIPRRGFNEGRVPVQLILGTDTPNDREVAIVASTLQWLGTNVGKEFLIRFIRTADIHV